MIVDERRMKRLLLLLLLLSLAFTGNALLFSPLTEKKASSSFALSSRSFGIQRRTTQRFASEQWEVDDFGRVIRNPQEQKQQKPQKQKQPKKLQQKKEEQESQQQKEEQESQQQKQQLVETTTVGETKPSKRKRFYKILRRLIRRKEL
mmetsp:Transcript_21031/g.23392  ORF Transcript_21031/g.23392 Transcript_21031/m.23392 type:complete len:148 (+) Transcript_21031:14-457(+)